jgi:hypothetical protein
MAARYDLAVTSNDKNSVAGLMSTNQVVVSSRAPLESGDLYAIVNTRVGPGYTEVGSRGAEIGYDRGPWFLGFGQSTGSEFSWITATAVTGNVGNLSLLSAFPKRSATFGVRVNASNAFRVLLHGPDGARANPGSGQEWSWVHKTERHTFRIAHHQLSAFGSTSVQPRQTGASLDTNVGPWTINLRYSQLQVNSGERTAQLGAGVRYKMGSDLSLVGDRMVSRSDLPERGYALASAGAIWMVHPQADLYLLGYRIQNDAAALRLVGAGARGGLGEDFSGLAFGVRLRVGFEM